MAKLTWEKKLLLLSSWVYNIFATGKRNLYALSFVDSPAERNVLHPTMKKKNDCTIFSRKPVSCFD